MSSAIALREARLGALRLVLLGGLIAGALDILDAFLFWHFLGPSPIKILHSIASGLLGRNAFSGGVPTAALGAVLHFLIALGAALAYAALALRAPLLVRQAILCGIAYGVGFYLFMNYIVLPLSAFPGKGGHTSLVMLANGLFAHTILFGLPIALCVRRALRPSRAS